MDALRLVLANDDVLDCGARHEVEDGIGVSPLSLLVAAALDALIALHLSVESLTRVDVHGFVEHDRLLGNRELNTREWEAWCWATTKIALCSVGTTLGAIALLVLAATKSSCRRQCGNKRNDEGRSKLHGD